MSFTSTRLPPLSSTVVLEAGSHLTLYEGFPSLETFPLFYKIFLLFVVSVYSGLV